MRRSTLPPRPRPEERRPRASEKAPIRPKRKVFNCIVDDTALIAGAKRSTRDGLRRWVSQGAIRLFVPLHTLTQLNRFKSGADQKFSADAQDALVWLDDITSTPAGDGRVELEGVDEAYTKWDDVQQFLLPETLLSMEDSDSDEEYQEDLESSFTALDLSDATSISSTQSPQLSPQTLPTEKNVVEKTVSVKDPLVRKSATPAITGSPQRVQDAKAASGLEKSSRGAVPVPLRSLFNHILWRINQEVNPDAALEAFILLTNDPAKQSIAQKFGIRAKRLDQLRDAVAREDREYKNHLTMYKMEAGPQQAHASSKEDCKANERPKSSHSSASQQANELDVEDDIVLNRAPRGPGDSRRVLDPNDFGRTQQPANRGRRGGFAAPQGALQMQDRSTPPRSPRGANAHRGSPIASGSKGPSANRQDPSRPIDPNSFARPSVRGNPQRGRGRTLWEPN